MKIKSLDISGFKSFCDQTKVLFDSSLTAVVGPNGCGKSNIVDAIRWALGEQSVKNLRGKGMEDVIFNGSAKRGPQSMAQVTLTFDNTDGLSHQSYVDYPEIAITRRLRREPNGNSTSDYLINRVPCRLKDITELFLGTGGGARAYSIIEQGRIGLIVSSRSEDRRSMFEEAAGITRFKKARTLAQRKMEKTRQNLLRVTDVVAEMGRSLSSLQRQARKAERYKKYAEEQLDSELYLASQKYLELLAVSKTVQSTLSIAEDAATNEKTELETAETKIESLRLKELSDRNQLEQEKTKSYEIDNNIAIIESEIRHMDETLRRITKDETNMDEQESLAHNKVDLLAEERKTIETKLDSLETDTLSTSQRREESELFALKARKSLLELGKTFDEKRDQMSRVRARIAASQSAFDNLHNRIEEAEARIESTRLEKKNILAKTTSFAQLVKEFEQKFEETEIVLSTAKKIAQTEGEASERLQYQLEECDFERQRVRDSLQGKASRLDSLSEMNTGLERHDRAVREAVEALRANGTGSFSGLLVDFVECPQKYEVALAAALADQLQALITTNHESGLGLLEWLKDRDLGRVTALASKIELLADSDDNRAQINNINDSNVHGKLVDFLKIDSIISETVAQLLGNIFVVNNTQEAKRLWLSYNGQASFVTLDGQLLAADGVMRGGCTNSPGSDLLGQKRQIRELKDEVSNLKILFEDLEYKFENIKEELDRRNLAAENARRETQQTKFIIAEIAKDKGRAIEDLEAAKERFDSLEQDVAHQEQQISQTKQDRDYAASEMVDAKSEIEMLEKTIVAHSQEIEHCRNEADRLAAAVTDAKVREAQFQQQQHAASDRLGQIFLAEEEIDDNLRRIAKRRFAGAKESGHAAGNIVKLKEALNAKLDTVEKQRGDIDVFVINLDIATQALTEAELLLKTKRSNSAKLNEQLSQLRMAEQEAHMDVSHLLDTNAEKHDVNLLRIIGDYHMRPLAGEETSVRIGELKGLIERMGAINPAAIEEFSEMQDRYSSKVEQKADVEQALEDLETAILKMDKDSKRLFKIAFENINEKFQEIFPRLFKGGTAKLLLTNPDDILSTGVDIVAQPPGKKLGNIELMSGGEKALTAVSLLFAIFLYRPSPFCLLDEVDAPLDEANVGRFIEMVQEMSDRSQFIVITHSKITMEGADALYGVTMQEPGVSKLISVRLVTQEDEAAVNA